jgi:uncharacterized cupin superfamily protein
MLDYRIEFVLSFSHSFLPSPPFAVIHENMNHRSKRPPFIISAASIPERRHSYPNSEENTGHTRGIGAAAGLRKIGVNLVRLLPGERSSWPHAEEKEEEFVYVLEGKVDAWIDGTVHPMKPGDFAAFPSGTGIAHCFINNTRGKALLLIGGQASRPNNRIYYPLHLQRRNDMPPSEWWHDVPKQQMGPHDGMSDALRRRTISPTSRAPQMRKKRS